LAKEALDEHDVVEPASVVQARLTGQRLKVRLLDNDDVTALHPF